MALLPAQTIKASCNKAKKFAKKYKACTKAAAKANPSVVALSVLVPGTALHSKLKKGSTDCAKLADKALDKIAKAKAVFKANKDRKGWTENKKKALRTKIRNCEKVVHRLLGLNATEAKVVTVETERKAVSDAGRAVTLSLSGKLPAAERASLNLDLKTRLAAQRVAGAKVPSDAQIDAMSDLDALTYEENLDASEDYAILGVEGLDEEAYADEEGILARIQERPVLSAVLGGGLAMGVLLLLRRR